MNIIDRMREFYIGLCSGPDGTEMWNNFLYDIKNLILNDDIRNFRNWGPIRQTMNAGNPTSGFSKDHLNLLKLDKDWERWEKALKDEFTTSAVNHSYYISKLENFVKPIDKFDFIFEFGGGFGNMCRTARNLGFSRKYLIFDFPELLTIQKYYLETHNITSDSEIEFCCDFDILSGLLKNKTNALCISTHALEEAPIGVMNRVLNNVKTFSAFLFVFSGGKSRFEEFVKENCSDFKLDEFVSLKGHYIITGTGK